MSGYEYIDRHASFRIRNPQHTSGLYLPVAGPGGLRSAVSPDFGGDSKLDQNHFLIAPKSIANLHSDRDTRNFFCVFEDGIWSACGASAQQEADRFTDREDEVELTGGRMWQTVVRRNKAKDISAEVTIFSLLDANVEIMRVKITNLSGGDASFTPVAAIPVYARSADNIRDHRHVTSLLNRAYVNEMGVVVKPTLSFDERGHQTLHTSASERTAVAISRFHLSLMRTCIWARAEPSQGQGAFWILQGVAIPSGRRRFPFREKR